MITDTTQDAQMRRSIQNAILNTDLQSLQRVAYEGQCEMFGLNPDGWKLYPEN